MQVKEHWSMTVQFTEKEVLQMIQNHVTAICFAENPEHTLAILKEGVAHGMKATMFDFHSDGSVTVTFDT